MFKKMDDKILRGKKQPYKCNFKEKRIEEIGKVERFKTIFKCFSLKKFKKN
jgi:hypothetical protein